MSNTAKSTRAANTRLVAIMAEEYDAGLSVPTTFPILWAAQLLFEENGDVEETRRQLRVVNAFRNGRGLIPAAVPYGHPLF